jgi:hypothetical protein
LRDATRHACLNKVARPFFVHDIEGSGVLGLSTEDMRESRGMYDRRYPFAGFPQHLGIADVSSDRLDAINPHAWISIKAANPPTCFMGQMNNSGPKETAGSSN